MNVLMAPLLSCTKTGQQQQHQEEEEEKNKMKRENSSSRRCNESKETIMRTQTRHAASLIQT